MSTALDVLNVARGEIGYLEGPNNDNKYGEWYGLNHNPYCAIFVSWCFAQAGVSALVAATTVKGFSLCSAGLGWFQKHGRIVNKYAGQPGDLVFFSWSGHTADHVGILVAASKDGITTIEGNTSADHKVGSQSNGDGVWLRHRPYLNVMAIARPKYPVALKPATSASQSKKVAAGVTAGATAIGGGAAVVNNNSSDTVKPTTVVTAAPFNYSKFRVGAPKSKEVLAVEQALYKAGLLPQYLVDGIYTIETTAAVKQYQKKNNLVRDGIVGPKTYSSLVARLKN